MEEGFILITVTELFDRAIGLQENRQIFMAWNKNLGQKQFTINIISMCSLGYLESYANPKVLALIILLHKNLIKTSNQTMANNIPENLHYSKDTNGWKSKTA